MDDLKPWPGKPYFLGASYEGFGTNFSLFSEVADPLITAQEIRRKVVLPAIYHLFLGPPGMVSI